MKDAEVVLCADAESLQNPSFVGLEGENLDAQKWLRVFCSAIEARRYIQSGSRADEVWVASSDDVDPINLAAALKKDSGEKGVYLVAFQGSGSLRSRANAAGLDGTLSQQDFLRRYTHYKQANLTSSDQKISSSNTVTVPHQEKQVTINLEEPLASLSRKVPATTITRGKTAHVLTVLSASGGAGKSTVAALSALFAQGLGYRTLLIDADLQFGDMRHFLGEEDPLTIDKAISNPDLIAKMKPDEFRPALLAAPQRLEEFEVLGNKLPSLIDTLKSQFDVIVLNTGAFWTEQHALLLEKSSTALFLVDQTPSSLRACKHALDLCVRCGIATHPFLFAINHCSRNASLTSIDVSCALQGSHVIELQEGGKDVSELLGAGLPFELIETRNNLCLSIEQMLLDILPEKEKPLRVQKEGKKENKRFRFIRKNRRVACL